LPLAAAALAKATALATVICVPPDWIEASAASLYASVVFFEIFSEV
jgi:hypothetical protein